MMFNHAEDPFHETQLDETDKNANRIGYIVELMETEILFLHLPVTLKA